MKKKIMMFAAFAAIVLGVGASGTANTALAAPGNGATVVNDTQCFEFTPYTYCFEQRGVSNETISPSGNQNFVFNGTSTYTVSDASGVLYTSESDGHYRVLINKDGELHVLSQKGDGTTTYAGVTCNYDYAYHFANGEVRRFINNIECS